jgi:hypothetical protein
MKFVLIEVCGDDAKVFDHQLVELGLESRSIRFVNCDCPQHEDR